MVGATAAGVSAWTLILVSHLMDRFRIEVQEEDEIGAMSLTQRHM
jgi:hypothetical protein